ncbi:MAG TPA: acyl carrier protein [Anaeromyxobacteraceae bacterium]|nr:acyl carrier protein [Anaeromyxobacteraceae bacterium]
MNAREQAVAAEIRRIARDELHARLSFGDEEELAGKLDSLALLSLVVAVEDRFRIALTEEDAARTRSLADLARLVAARAAPEVLP